MPADNIDMSAGSVFTKTITAKHDVHRFQRASGKTLSAALSWADKRRV